MVPLVVPFSIIETPISGSPFLSFTVPATGFVFCWVTFVSLAVSTILLSNILYSTFVPAKTCSNTWKIFFSEAETDTRRLRLRFLLFIKKLNPDSRSILCSTSSIVQSLTRKVIEVFCAYPSDAYASPAEQIRSINSNFIANDISFKVRLIDFNPPRNWTIQ